MGSPLTERARELRREMTALETIVWFELKGKKLDGYKFRRQAPIGPYIADFYCPAARLVVEIDGPVHNDRQAVMDTGLAISQLAAYGSFGSGRMSRGCEWNTFSRRSWSLAGL